MKLYNSFYYDSSNLLHKNIKVKLSKNQKYSLRYILQFILTNFDMKYKISRKLFFEK